MAYSGSTAASSVANPPRKLIEGMTGLRGTTGLSTAPASPGNQGGALWVYTSTNLTTDLTASGFFSDGKDLGMRPGDIVMGCQFSSAGSSVMSYQGTITGVSTAGATLGAMITSTYT
jgi:hypothetical protein